MMDKPIIVTLELPAEIMKRFEERAQEEHRPLIDLLRERLVSTFDEDEDDVEWEEDSNEKILADLRESLEDMKAGRMRDAREVIEEIRQELKLKNHDAH